MRSNGKTQPGITRMFQTHPIPPYGMVCHATHWCLHALSATAKSVSTLGVAHAGCHRPPIQILCGSPGIAALPTGWLTSQRWTTGVKLQRNKCSTTLPHCEFTFGCTPGRTSVHKSLTIREQWQANARAPLVAAAGQGHTRGCALPCLGPPFPTVHTTCYTHL
jgi:hypothetical protein